MIAAVFLGLVAAGPEGLPESFCLVWQTRAHLPICILGPYDARFTIKGVHYQVSEITRVPDGTYFSKYAAARDVKLDREGHGFGGGPKVTQIIVQKPASDFFTGSFRVTLGKPDGNGRISYLELFAKSDSGDAIYNDILTPVCSLSAISFSGVYSDGTIGVDFSDTGGAKPAITGKLTYQGKTYVVKGSRRGIWGWFDLTSMDEGKNVGSGWFEWLPTPTRVREIADGKAKLSDQLYVWIDVPSTGLPIGLGRTLPEKQK